MLPAQALLRSLTQNLALCPLPQTRAGLTTCGGLVSPTLGNMGKGPSWRLTSGWVASHGGL